MLWSLRDAFDLTLVNIAFPGLPVAHLLRCALSPKRALSPKFVPLSVNWHFCRDCNYECKFCFHTAKTSLEAQVLEIGKGCGLSLSSWLSE